MRYWIGWDIVSDPVLFAKTFLAEHPYEDRFYRILSDCDLGEGGEEMTAKREEEIRRKTVDLYNMYRRGSPRDAIRRVMQRLGFGHGPYTRSYASIGDVLEHIVEDTRTLLDIYGEEREAKKKEMNTVPMRKAAASLHEASDTICAALGDVGCEVSYSGLQKAARQMMDAAANIVRATAEPSKPPPTPFQIGDRVMRKDHRHMPVSGVYWGTIYAIDMGMSSIGVETLYSVAWDHGNDYKVVANAIWKP